MDQFKSGDGKTVNSFKNAFVIFYLSIFFFFFYFFFFNTFPIEVSRPDAFDLRIFPGRTDMIWPIHISSDEYLKVRI